MFIDSPVSKYVARARDQSKVLVEFVVKNSAFVLYTVVWHVYASTRRILKDEKIIYDADGLVRDKGVLMTRARCNSQVLVNDR